MTLDPEALEKAARTLDRERRGWDDWDCITERQKSLERRCAHAAITTYLQSIQPGDGVATTLDKVLTVAHAHVESITDKADGYSCLAPWWHGWAIRKAFIAGAQWHADQARLASRSPSPLQELVEALEKCRSRFAEYVEIHSIKSRNLASAEYSAKALRNQEMVDLCDAALAKAYETGGFDGPTGAD